MMTDRGSNLSLGSALLAVWAQAHLQFSDVNLPNDETSLERVQKNPGAERGRRLCAKGEIIRMDEPEQTRWGNVNHGLLIERKIPVYFMAVRGTGKLTKNTPARFCGVVTGTFDAPGTHDAIQIVGMFDLPENRSSALPAKANQ
jgi:hypothetical protein